MENETGEKEQIDTKKRSSERDREKVREEKERAEEEQLNYKGNENGGKGGKESSRSVVKGNRKRKEE